MARNRSNRGSDSARRAPEDVPARDGTSQQKPVQATGAPPAATAHGASADGTSTASAAKPGPGAASPDMSGRTPPAATPSGSATTAGAPPPTTQPAAAPAASRPATAATEPRAVNAHAAAPAAATSSSAAPKPAGGAPAASGQRPQSGGPDRPGSGGGRTPTAGGSSGGRRGGRDFGVGLLGGVIGGAAVALLILWSQGGSDEVAALQGRLAEVESNLAGASDTSGVESLAERVQALESASGDELLARLEALEAQGSGEADIEQRLAALESSGTTGGGAGGGAGGGNTEASGAALQETVTSLQDRVSQLDQRLGAAEEAESRLQQLSGRVDQLTQEIQTDEQQGQQLASQLSALDGRVSEAESRLEAASSDRERAAALALIAGQLEAAIDEARPYETQVAALSAMTASGGADDPIAQAVRELEPGAAGGVPSIAALRQSFVPVANEIVHASRSSDGDNLLNRATDNLMRLVTVRPVGDDVRGDTAEARVARAEAALDKGDLASAVAELDQLEDRPAEAAADWLTRARERLGADQAVAQLRTQATDLLSQTH